ncbi:MAG: fumarylacetoacetate hydrolase family protein [Microbacteriaceae bacterium]
MKIARFTHAGRTRLGVVDGAEVLDVGSADDSLPTDVGDLLRAGALDAVAGLTATAGRIALGDVRLEAPIAQPPEFLAIGLNYALHVAERKDGSPEPPAVPQVFNKQVTCINGPYDPIEIPDAAPSRVDYEGELAVVIGARCRAVPRERAHEVVAGYMVANDVSVRDWQKASATLTMGKSWDTHGPIGPWLVTADEIPDPHDLRLRTWVDGELRQDDTTAHMINDCWALIEYISTAFTLLPGTIISTGTPAGVGVHRNPPGLLAPGMTVRVEIERIGAIENPVVAQVRTESLARSA